MTRALLSDTRNFSRVGFVQDQYRNNKVLPKHTSSLLEKYKLSTLESSETIWDFFWSSTTDEARETTFLQRAVKVEADPIFWDDVPPERTALAEAALKVRGLFYSRSYA